MYKPEEVWEQDGKAAADFLNKELKRGMAVEPGVLLNACWQPLKGRLEALGEFGLDEKRKAGAIMRLAEMPSVVLQAVQG